MTARRPRIARILGLAACFLTVGSGSSALPSEGPQPVRWSFVGAEAKGSIYSTYVADATSAYVTTHDAFVVLDLSTGHVRWRVPRTTAVAVANGIVYGNENAHGDGPYSEGGYATLAARDAHDGRLLWRKPHRGGVTAADATGVFVAGDGLTRFDRHGNVRWHATTQGHEYGVIVTANHVSTWSGRSGAIFYGALDTFVRSTGAYLGSVAYVQYPLSIDDTTARASRDFMVELSWACNSAEILEISLQHPNAQVKTARFDFAHGRNPVCLGQRFGQLPLARLDGDTVVLASGSIMGFFDRTRPAKPYARYDDVRFVGGPFMHRLYAQRGNALVALVSSAHEVRIAELTRSSEAQYVIAGVGARIYASDGRTTSAFDARSNQRLATFAFGCRTLLAVGETASTDVLACDSGVRPYGLLLIGVTKTTAIRDRSYAPGKPRRSSASTKSSVWVISGWSASHG